MDPIHSFRWIGSQAPHLDRPELHRCGQMVIGCYGGNSQEGARTNEDAALAWCQEDGSWEFAALLDAHNSVQSAEVILKAIELEKKSLRGYLDGPIKTAFPHLQEHLVSRFTSPALRARLQFSQGETSCLICARKDRFLWWLSIGDCSLFLLHPDLARLGQFELNQRNYYEWIGKANTFDLPIPSYSSGIRELRGGSNVILMSTDGLLDGGDRSFSNPRRIYQEFIARSDDLFSSTLQSLKRLHAQGGRDSATTITWRIYSPEPGLQAS